MLQIPVGARERRIHWEIAPTVLFVHFASLLVFLPWLFDWRSVFVAILTVPFFGTGINLCYHRLLAHRSFETPLWVERVLVAIALCCLQDTPAAWVANHRVHHAKADRVEDPHSPLVSFFWSHCGWLTYVNEDATPLGCFQKYVRDLLDDPFYMRLERGFLRETIFLLHALAFIAVGFVLGWAPGFDYAEGGRLGLSFLVWGVLARTVAIWHITWSVNSVCHKFGYRSFETNDQSRNNLFVGYLAGGEGWHNNHHADPGCATTKREWWEFDLIHQEIRLLEWLGLASEVAGPRQLDAEPEKEAS